MINYICENCNDTICETSVCPICGERTYVNKSEIYWCEECNTPTFDTTCKRCENKCYRIGTDLRPVFPEERLLIEILLDEPMKYRNSSVWKSSGSIYYVDGKKLRLSFKELMKKNPEEVILKLKEYEEENRIYVDNFYQSPVITNFIESNRIRFNYIESEAIDYIRKISEKFNLENMFVSFSGGKDSTVTSSLVMSALGTEEVVHIFGDTTLEYPETYKYVERFKSIYNTPMISGKNEDQEFKDLVDVVGPPSRVMRWCCTVFKAGAINNELEMLYDSGSPVLSFQGIRRRESTSRSKYKRDSQSPKIASQTVSSPIIDWLDFDIWLYILTKGIDFNHAYKQGFSRVGCWCCPNNSGWSEYLSSIYMNDEYKKWKNQLYRFAEKVGKKDWKIYVDEGNWKSRQGGNGLSYSENAVISFKPCAFEEKTYNFDLSRPINDYLYTLFKPFGTLDFAMGNKRLNEVYVKSKKTGELLFRISGKKGGTLLKVSVLGTKGVFKNKKKIESYLRSQITKFQTCIGCSACANVCRFNAITVKNLEPGTVSRDSILYEIDENKCVGCLECVNHFDSGCYMKKVLRTKKGE